MNILRTDRTYATVTNARKALEAAVEKIGARMDAIRYVIAVSEDGRFAPVVVLDPRGELLALCHVGVTVVG